MEILTSVASEIAKYTVAPIGRQVGYLLFYTDNFKKLIDQVAELEAARDDIKCLVEAETRNGREILLVVQNWLDQVDEITRDARQLCGDPRREKVGCLKCSFPNLWWRHQLSRKAKKAAKNVADVKGKGKFDGIAYLPPLDGPGSTSATNIHEMLGSRNSIMKEIMQALTDPKISKIGVYGLGGMGKTTLVKQIAQKARNDKMFDAVVMANVTRTPEIDRIRGEIADLLGLRFEEMTAAGRTYRLHERIKKEKTILIILDDIWKEIGLDEVGIPSEGNHKGCKVLLVSRNRDVLDKMEIQKDFKLEVLNGEETWSLFKVMAGDVVNDPNFQNIATNVAQNCAGLPVLVVTVARALKNKDIHAWKDALNQLQRVERGEMNEIIYSALELSYDWLGSNELKALFLLCGVKGGNNSVTDLLKYGIGFGIFGHMNTVEDARNRLYKMIGTLKASCLLLEDGASFVEMHDIVREVALFIASRDQHVFVVKQGHDLKQWPPEDSFKRCTQIILKNCGIPKLPERLDCPVLKFFYLDSGSEIPDSFFEGMRSLKVLDITSMDMPSLPTSFRCLTNLQTLCLDACGLGDMAGIGALKNVEILSLMYSYIKKLPNELGQLSNLKMLDFSSSKIEAMPPNVISNLTKLEELYMGNASIKWEVENPSKHNRNASLAELIQLPYLIALDIQMQEAEIMPWDLSFVKLERFKIYIGDVWGWFNEFETLKTLKLKLSTNIHLEHGIKALIERVENLYVDEINGISNVLYQLNKNGFPLLKRLHVQNNANIQHLIDSVRWNQTTDSFPNLETLVLHNLNSLEKICHGPLTVNSFSKLRVLIVIRCNQLKYLFSFSMVKALCHLLEIEVSECSSMKNIVFVEGDNREDNCVTTGKMEFLHLHSFTLEHLPAFGGFSSEELTEQKSKLLTTYMPMPFFSSKIAFPNLETLKLSSINLNKIWDDNSATCIRNLTSLIVEDCGDLKYLFSSSVDGSFSNLKSLQISKCCKMEEIIATNEVGNNVVCEEDRFPKLEVIVINDMENLKTSWHFQFHRLNTLEVINCEKLVYIFPSQMQGRFCSLETLMVHHCGSVKEIFELNANKTGSVNTTQLRQLTLTGLPKLKQIWSMEPEAILSFHDLEFVQLVFCENLEYLFPFSVATDLQKLKGLYLESCVEMKTIVGKKGEQMEDQTALFVLNRLSSLGLKNLHKLRGFFAGNYTLACPSMKKLNVTNCKTLKLFKMQSMSHRESCGDGLLAVSTEQPLFTAEEVISNLEELNISQSQFSGELFFKQKLLQVSNFEDEQATFPYLFLQNVPRLDNLVVEKSSFKKIFQDEGFVGEEGQNRVCTRIKFLTLHELHELHHICKEGSQIDPILKALEGMKVSQCSSLTILVPSYVTFSQMTYLEVTNCNGLISLIASPTARSLVRLSTLKIVECNSLEEIVTEMRDETKDDISFSSLELLELISLPRISRLCSSKCCIKFPLLRHVVASQCPRMDISLLETQAHLP